MRPEDPWRSSGRSPTTCTTRTLTVVPAEAGYGATLFRQSYERMANDERRGKYGTTVWGRGPGGAGVAGRPEGGALKFRSPQGRAGFGDVVGTTALSAIITVDRRNGSILAVRFRGPRRVGLASTSPAGPPALSVCSFQLASRNRRWRGVLIIAPLTHLRQT
jgi:hypothetical protein